MGVRLKKVSVSAPSKKLGTPKGPQGAASGCIDAVQAPSSRVLLVVGTGPRIAPDVSAARAILDGVDHHVMCVNNAGEIYTSPIQYVATWHPEHIDRYKARRAAVGGNTDFACVAQFEHPDALHVPVFLSGGSSALYAVLAGQKLGYTHIVVAGVTLEGEYASFQRGWHKSFEAIKNNVRAMSGFPRDLLGSPAAGWLSATNF